MMKIASLILFMLAAGCGGGSSNDTAMLRTETSAADYSYDEYEVEESIIESSDITQETPAPKREQQIIRTGHLEFESKDPAATHAKILQLVEKYNGTVQNDNSGKGYNRIFRTIVVRVPSQNFMSFIEGVSEGVDYFDQRNISARDVTEEFVDLEARLKAKRELENRYLELLKQAKNVKEILEIERELSTIREEIEARQGRLEYLKSQVSMSTVTIEVYKLTSETGITESYGQKMKNALAGGWDGISVFFLGILYAWPLLIVIAIIFFAARWLIRKNRIKQ
ncbi:DUF4349 domain-containing protein [Jejudonia soesokkakensis]|uniref:DUF4349 domain-containing protein n=1 Tax=Jejudonia soesokkakensis TaxID=1323432 RepID=A0ABW2MR60_9FLAO